MKLRNNKTWGIEELEGIYVADNKIFMTTIDEDGKRNLQSFVSFAELCDEWEDYEEPKEFYHINVCGDIGHCPIDTYSENALKKMKEIGNYFESEEEAKKAVEKLKARKKDLTF